MLFKKLQSTIQEQREKERLIATVHKQEALLEYVALMTDVELPCEETNNLIESESTKNE